MTLKNKVKKHKLLLQNFGYLSALQILLLLLPLATYPYLIRVLGGELYGLIIYMQSLMAFFTILINFGLNIFSTKDVAIHKDNLNRLSEIFSTVLLIKILLFVVGFVILLTLVFTTSFFKQHIILTFVCYSMCISEVLFPVWFYQGIEKMKYITIVSAFSKIIFTVLVFVLIKSKADYLWMPGLLSIGALLGGGISLYLVFKVEKISIKLINNKKLLIYGRRSLPFFFSRVSAVLSIQTNAVLIGSFIGMKEVAYYDLAKKIVELFKIPNSLINQTVYPKVAREKNVSFVKKVFYLRIIISVFLYCIILLFGKYIVFLLGGEDMIKSVDLLYYFSLMIPLTGMTYYLGTTVLVSFNYEDKFNKSVIYSTLFYLSSTFILFIFNKVTVYNLIYLIVITEFLLFIYRFYFCKKYKII